MILKLGILTIQNKAINIAVCIIFFVDISFIFILPFVKVISVKKPKQEFYKIKINYKLLVYYTI